ncbi:2-phospho-L-lactate transferase [Microbacterium sp. LRZ72]|uniref:2-phospho-L-lactate transferase n=1 Tax=Microbacterium sp. LRZ72 TaxID=2942481 RepID=UPI0029BA5B4A|nr:2-phospho-L-lactate transferase [Microbacterium sp. LRZ72]MDX2376419.1 2-phospho-L-lactate transferase [Microbacterium sp. LRZ72]
MSASRRVVLLAGGVGGSTFARGLREHLRRTDPHARITIVANTGDDMWLTGVRLQPDVDSLLYALAGVNDTERGWGRAGESERVSAELRAWGAGWPWFTLGDLDLGTHLARTGWLREGAGVAEVVRRLCGRWPIGAEILPMTEAEVDTIVTVRDGADERPMHFQEWWTRYRASLEPVRFDNPGVAEAEPAPGVARAIADADVVVVAPSNPVVSVGPIVAVPGIRVALRETDAPVVGVSPIIGGRAVRGMAEVCLAAIGAECSASGVAQLYGARDDGGLLDAWLVAEEDAGAAPAVDALGIRAGVAPLWMRDLETSAALAAAALELARRGSAGR